MAPQEGQPTATLFQIVRGTLRVELQLAGQAQAVVVGYRNAGEMLGETSLLKEGRATASIVAEETTTVVCIEGKSLETLITTHPGLPSRFFCFLAPCAPPFGPRRGAPHPPAGKSRMDHR